MWTRSNTVDLAHDSESDSASDFSASTDGGGDSSLVMADADARDFHFRRLAKTTPERAADIILRGTARGKRRIMVGWDAWLILQLTKILPTRYHWVTARVADD